MTDDTTIFELRSYRVLEGRHEEFAEHVRTVRLPVYARLGWRCDGFWIPEDDPTRVFYTLRWRSHAERDELRAALASDPEWLAYKHSDPEPLVEDFVATLMTRVG